MLPPMLRYLATSLALSLLLFAWYAAFHIHRIDDFQIRVEGSGAWLLCLLLALAVVHLARHLWRVRAELPRLLRPTRRTLAVAAAVLLLTPILNIVWVPFTFGIWLVLWALAGEVPELTPGSATLFLAFAALAWLATCLARPSTARPRGAPEIVPLYLWTVYAAETLLAGIYRIW